MRFSLISRRTLVFGTALLVGLTGCDSGGTDGDVEAEMTLNGQVTDDAGYAARAADSSARIAPIEGAAVTAASISADGSTRALRGSATTDAEGRFSLETEGTADPVLVIAEAGDFRSSALIEAGAARRGSVTAPPMTAESNAEADVFLAARARAARVNVADAVAYVSARTAADLEAGTTEASEVAASIAAAVETEAAYFEEDETSGEELAEEAQDERDERFAAFRASLAAATTAEARTAAVEAFEEAYAEAYAEVGAAATRAAQASQAGASASVRLSSDTRFATEQRARLNAALATALAVETAFEAAGASDERTGVIVEAGADLAAAIRAASSDEAIAEGEANFASSVRTELAAEADLSATALAAATAATATAEVALDASLQAATTAEAVAEAYATFYAAAEGAVSSVLEAEATFVVELITLLSVY